LRSFRFQKIQEENMRTPHHFSIAWFIALTMAAMAVCHDDMAHAQAQPETQPDLRVTLLGTGSPSPIIERFGPSTLVEAGSEKLVFDCGRGCPIRLQQRGVRLGDVKLFLTHLHSDHLNGIVDLWLTGWLSPPFGQRKSPFVMIGPEGTKNMAAHLEEAFMPDIRIRMADEKLAREGVRIEATDIVPGVVYEANGVKVTAFEVDHGDLIKPAYGYRVDYRGRSVVLSGDTRFSQNVIKFATGADLLIHEVAMARPEVAQTEAARRILAHHTSPQEAGRVFEMAKPRLAVFAHISTAGGLGPSAPQPADFIAATRETYAGPLVFGVDLMTINIGEAVTVTADRPAVSK
jgi:ribonuclease Z